MICRGERKCQKDLKINQDDPGCFIFLDNILKDLDNVSLPPNIIVQILNKSCHGQHLRLSVITSGVMGLSRAAEGGGGAAFTKSGQIPNVLRSFVDPDFSTWIVRKTA